MIIEHKNLCIFFGDAHTSISVADLQEGVLPAVCQKFVKEQEVELVAAVRQVHGIDIITVDGTTDSWRTHEGDALITDRDGVGLAVFTADCLPVVLYDANQGVLGVVHAGWRGALAGIVQKTVEQMVCEHGSTVSDIEVFLGPAAKGCCYQIGAAVYDQIPEFMRPACMQMREAKMFFDLGLYVVQELVNLGINKTFIYTKNNVCTICTPGYCSYRNQKEKANRQITFAWKKRCIIKG